VDQHTGLAAAGAGDDQHRFGRRGNGLTLRLVQGSQDGGDVHDYSSDWKLRSRAVYQTIGAPHGILPYARAAEKTLLVLERQSSEK
jgi:hypothetical protein